MSVCTFGAEELANVAALIVNGNRYADDRYEGRIIEALAKVSEANVACFNDRYKQHAGENTPITAREIARALLRSRLTGNVYRCDFERAHVTASLLHYNCDDEGGDFTQKIEGASAALISILEGVNAALLVKMGVRT